MMRSVPWVALALLASGQAVARGYVEEPSFIRVSPRDARYFETGDGKAFIPNGLNLIAPPWGRGPGGGEADARLEALDGWFAKLEANRANFIRVWLSNDFYEVEHQKAGQYDPERARRIDAMLALARKHGIRVKMTIEHFREIDLAHAKQPWATKPLHHASRGGLAETMEGWTASPAARKQFVGKLEFLAGRYRDDPTVYGWELWNEMNALRGSPDYLGWTRAMLPELHRLFPRQLAMQSLGSFDGDYARSPYRALALMPGNDVAQVHRYLDLGAKLEVCHGPVDVLAADAVRELLAWKPGKPVMLAESGAVEPSHAGPFKLYEKDRAGIILHDVLFSAFFAGAAGAGQCWHWDQYVDRNDLWWQFGRFAEATKDLDPPAEAFEPVLIDHPDLRIYLLKGRHTWLAWCRDRSNDWKSELAEQRPPTLREGLRIRLGSPSEIPGFNSPRIYDPWKDRWATATPDRDEIPLPPFSRSIVVRLGR